MRTLWIVTALVVFACAAVSADPILLAPTGKTLGTGEFRVEGAFGSDDHDGDYFWGGVGFMQFEANLIRLDDVDGHSENLIGVQWNFMPETFATPAVSFGVTDVASDSDDGIGGYAAITKRLDVGVVVPLIKSVTGTAGVGIGGISGVFGGVQVKFPAGFFVEGEYDTNDFNGAVGWQPFKMLKLKAYSIRDDIYFGAEVRPLSF